jgi:DNA polymerase elongation subunit (family B)
MRSVIMNNAIAFDIETIPNVDKILSLPEPEVLIGNIKDTFKIENKIKQSKEKQIERMALNPFYGRICSFAIWGEMVREVRVMDKISNANEIEIIRDALGYLQTSSINYPSIVTFNGMEFDFPFLFKRAWILDIEIPNGCPSVKYFTKRYSDVPHCDLAKELCGWSSGKYISLDEAAGVKFGEEKVKIDVTQFTQMILDGKQNEIGIYNLKDAELTYRLYKSAEGYIFN